MLVQRTLRFREEGGGGGGSLRDWSFTFKVPEKGLSQKWAKILITETLIWFDFEIYSIAAVRCLNWSHYQEFGESDALGIIFGRNILYFYL